jgi:Stage II sporulation protein M
MSESTPGEEGPLAQRTSSNLLDNHRIALVLALLVLEVVIFIGGLFTPLSASTQQGLANETGSQFAPFDSAGPVQLALLIFTHNLTIALTEMIPVAGAVIFAYSVYSTGIVAQALVVSQGVPAPWGLVLFAYPYSIVELSAYALAVGSGVMILIAWRRKRLRRELRVFLLEGLVVGGILLTAAAMEATTKFFPLTGFALWLPTGLALAVLIVATRKRHT